MRSLVNLWWVEKGQVSDVPDLHWSCCLPLACFHFQHSSEVTAGLLRLQSPWGWSLAWVSPSVRREHYSKHYSNSLYPGMPFALRDREEICTCGQTSFASLVGLAIIESECPQTTHHQVCVCVCMTVLWGCSQTTHHVLGGGAHWFPAAQPQYNHT